MNCFLKTLRFKRRPCKLMAWECPNVKLGEFQITWPQMRNPIRKSICARVVYVDSDHYMLKEKTNLKIPQLYY